MNYDIKVGINVLSLKFKKIKVGLEINVLKKAASHYSAQWNETGCNLSTICLFFR